MSVAALLQKQEKSPFRFFLFERNLNMLIYGAWAVKRSLFFQYGKKGKRFLDKVSQRFAVCNLLLEPFNAAAVGLRVRVREEKIARGGRRGWDKKKTKNEKVCVCWILDDTGMKRGRAAAADFRRSSRNWRKSNPSSTKSYKKNQEKL